ncbi:MAG: hypothetical protein Q4G52_03370 [Clostridia bacterium]|nr:hypothetical protein [Clostridia bacterium]
MELTLLMAQVHDFLMRLNDGFELEFGDKDMHFIIMALLGMLLFFVVHFIFKRLAKWSVTAISFIYVFTVMTVLGFAIEIGQKISGTGEMDFADVVAGLYGVLLFFAVYTVYRLLVMLCGWGIRRVKERRLMQEREMAVGTGARRRRVVVAGQGEDKGEKQQEEH